MAVPRAALRGLGGRQSPSAYAFLKPFGAMIVSTGEGTSTHVESNTRPGIEADAGCE